MTNLSETGASGVTPKLAAPQQKPRPLPLFLHLLRSETAANPDRMARALAGLRTYQQVPRPARPEPMPVVASAHGAMLRDYGGDGPPLVVVPSLINPPDVLDLAPDNSLLRRLRDGGRRILLLDWGEVTAARKRLSVTGHVEQIALPLVRLLGEPPALLGYCLGGTMAVGVASAVPVERVATIAAPWRFSGYGDAPRHALAAMWRDAGPLAEQLGVLPMEVLQTAFWNLDPARTVAKFERLADLAADSEAMASFVTLEDWANDGPPLPGPAARELFEAFIRDDAPGSGGWRIEGRAVDPAALPCPLLTIASTTDRIVPHASASEAGERIDLALGHVGMVVGSHAREALWEPLAAWLSPHRSG
jgi:polyhydroxyalkanoate synthase